MIKALLILVLLVSCGEGFIRNGMDGRSGLDGVDGLNGEDGLNYYSYLISGNLQEIVGDNRREEFNHQGAQYYQVISNTQLNVDNPYYDCELQEVQIVVESEQEGLLLTFQPTENRYRMALKRGTVNKVLDSSFIKVYYKENPKVICTEGEYELHSGFQFEVRVIKPLEVE